MTKPLILTILSAAAPTAPLLPNGDYAASECPVAGNVDSGIYHVADSRDYGKMLAGGKANPLRVACFATEAEATGAGYRRSKR
jgi:hypothetical protein